MSCSANIFSNGGAGWILILSTTNQCSNKLHNNNIIAMPVMILWFCVSISKSIFHMKLRITFACLFILNNLRYYSTHFWYILNQLVLSVTITAVTGSVIMVLLIISFMNSLFVFNLCYSRIPIHQNSLWIQSINVLVCLTDHHMIWM